MPTKMGGGSATGNFEDSIASYVMLAEGKEEISNKSGGYFKPGKKEDTPLAVTEDVAAQDKLLEACRKFTGVDIA